MEACYRKHKPLDCLIQRLAQILCDNQAVEQTNIKDKKGWTPLHTAAYFNNIEMILILLDHNANARAVTNSLEKPSDLTEHELNLKILSSQHCTHTHPILAL